MFYTSVLELIEGSCAWKCNFMLHTDDWSEALRFVKKENRKEISSDHAISSLLTHIGSMRYTFHLAGIF